MKDRVLSRLKAKQHRPTEAQVLATINELCVSVQKMNVALAAIIETIPMADDQREALLAVGVELGQAFAVLQAQVAPKGPTS